MPLDTKAVAEATAAVVKAHVAALIDPVREAVAALEKRIDALPVPRDGRDADEDAVAAKVHDRLLVRINELSTALAAIPQELPDIAGMVEESVADARWQDVAQIQARLDGIDEKIASIPVPKDGKDGADGAPGRDGRDAEPVSAAQIAEAVAEYLEANPPAPGKDGRDGVDGRDGKDGEPGEKGADGRDGAPGRDGIDGRDGVDGKDGAGLVGGVIDRDGNLILMLSNGDQKNLGQVVGRDGAPGKDGAPGRDGFSLKEFEVELMEDGRTILLKFDDGGPVSYARELGIPTMIYRGVYREGVYQKGDTVTFGGSLWHSNKDDNAEKPDSGTGSWTLAAKRGRDGKDAA